MPIRRYWSGLGASVALTTPAFTMYMVAYRQTKRELTPVFGSDAMTTYILSGAAAEICSSFIWTPMEVVKGRAQICESGSSTFSILKSIYAAEGAQGFFRGYWMGIAVFVPHSIVWWISYEKTKSFLANYQRRKMPGTEPIPSTLQRDVSAELSPTMIAIASATGTTSATCAANFLDVVKTRQQLAASDEIKLMRPDEAKGGVLTVARNLIKEAGLVRAMVKGLHIRLLNAVPSGVLTMVIVETLNPDIDIKNTDQQGMDANQLLQ